MVKVTEKLPLFGIKYHQCFGHAFGSFDDLYDLVEVCCLFFFSHTGHVDGQNFRVVSCGCVNVYDLDN